MANHNSAKKAIRQIAKREQVNRNRKTRVKTYSKKVLEAVQAGEKDKAQAAFREAQSEIMKSVSKGVMKLNTASRRVAKLCAKVKKLVMGA